MYHKYHKYTISMAPNICGYLCESSGKSRIPASSAHVQFFFNPKFSSFFPNLFDNAILHHQVKKLVNVIIILSNRVMGGP